MSHSSNGRNKCCIKTNIFYQICAFHGEVNTIRYFVKIVLKILCYFAFICWVPSSYYLYLHNIRDFNYFDWLQKVQLIIKFCYKFRFCKFFFTIYRNFSLLWLILAKCHEYICIVLIKETNVTSKQINSIRLVRFTVR